MWNRLSWAVTCLLLLAAPAWAQQSPPAADAAASAAMERARRQAAGPMRVILEASKSKRRVQEPEVTETPEAPRRAVARTAAAEAPVILTRSVAPTAVSVPSPAAVSVAQPVSPAPVPLVASAAPAVANAAVEPGNAGAISTQITLSSDNLQRRADNIATPALESAARPPAVEPVPAADLALPALQDVKPKLVTMVDPAVSPAMLDGLRRDTGVTADLVIRADGTVAGVTVLPPVSRPLARAVAAALEQWRFEPLPSQRVHRVQLVFND